MVKNSSNLSHGVCQTFERGCVKPLTPFHAHQEGCVMRINHPVRCASRLFDRPIILGRYSPSQNGIVVSPVGIALCLAGGGNGHDTDKPKILIEYEL